eukprot:m51a1_g2811 putative calcineurin b subunit (179) ;mRNA; f:133844-134719
MGNKVCPPKNADLEAMMTTTNFTPVELRRLFQRMQMLQSDPAFPRGADPAQPVPDHRAVLGRVLSLLGSDPKKDEDNRFIDFVATMAVLSDKEQRDGKLRFAFNMFDVDGDGAVSNRDAFTMLRALVPNVSETQLQRLVDRAFLEADDNHDGMLAFDEFSRLLVKNDDVFDKLTISWQ